MKLTSKILLLLGVVMIAALLSSNMILKHEYDSIDKSDIYWTYDKVLEQPFKYLNITGGNSTNIFYEPAAKPSVRLLHEWVKYHGGKLEARVINDTLFINFDYKSSPGYETFWLKSAVPVRIFSPELLLVTGNNTNFEMQKLRQKSITVNISGKSKFEVESIYPEMDSINVTQSDSSAVIFEMSPDYKKQPSKDEAPGKIQFHNAAGVPVTYPSVEQNDFNECMTIHAVTANVKDHSILDIGHAQIEKLQMQVSDSSAIVLSGGALKKKQ